MRVYIVIVLHWQVRPVVPTRRSQYYSSRVH